MFGDVFIKKNESNIRKSPFWNSNLHSRATVRREVGHDSPSPDDDAKSDGQVTVVDVTVGLWKRPSGDDRHSTWYRPQHFHELLWAVGPLIEKQTTRMRRSISAGERLAVTLYFSIKILVWSSDKLVRGPVFGSGFSLGADVFFLGAANFFLSFPRRRLD